MGFETAVVVFIFFIALFIMATHSYAVISDSGDLISDAQEIRYQLQEEKLNTDIDIRSIDTDNDDSALIIEAENKGNTILSCTKVNILVDGVLAEHTFSSTSERWYPGEIVTYTVERPVGTNRNRVKMIAENGVSDNSVYFKNKP